MSIYSKTYKLCLNASLVEIRQFFDGLDNLRYSANKCVDVFQMEKAVVSFNDPTWSWNNGKAKHELEKDGAAIVIIPTAGLDYWSKTFYEPLLIKHDAQCLLCSPIPAGVEATLTTSFTLSPRAQFDQAGIMVLVNEDTWVKAGIEYTDGVPRLSCVVTNDGYSDWSTQAWHFDNPCDDNEAKVTSIRIRVSKLFPGSNQGPAMVFEAAPMRSTTESSLIPWTQIRIASLRSREKPWRMGLFVISPIEAAGCYARFHHVTLGPKENPVHGSKLDE